MTDFLQEHMDPEHDPVEGMLGMVSDHGRGVRKAMQVLAAPSCGLISLPSGTSTTQASDIGCDFCAVHEVGVVSSSTNLMHLQGLFSRAKYAIERGA